MQVYDQARTGSVAKARELRRNSTDAEKQLWRGIRKTLPHFKWRRQMPVGPYIVDLACFAERLVIELDGSQHAEAAEYDADRTRYLQSQGYRVIRFWNNDVLCNMSGLLARIAAELESSPIHSEAADTSLSQGRGNFAEAAS
jgi:very-short-patch-repair endonuclease